MIEIVVVAYNSEAPARPLSARFDEAGGTIGRSDDNQFILPDPKHHVSRRQAAVASDGVRHRITNLSHANPTLLNGVELESDVAHPLQSGDEICIGLYRLQARAVVHAPASAATGATPAVNARPLSFPLSFPLPSPVPPRTDAMQRPRQPVVEALAPSHASFPPPGMAAPSTAQTATPAVMPAPADAQALLQAFLDGAGISDITLSSGLTPELMTMIGALLASAIDGTVDLIGLRALVKREVNADVTMVVVRNNNPLKFLPDGPTVLTQMLRKRMPGFMSPTEAMQDAYDDLHAHQLGMMAGMQATLADLHGQLDPLAIEGSGAPASLLERMLPAGRKARHWDHYCQRHRESGETLGNATQSIARKAFLVAYERASEDYKDEAADGR